MNEAARFACPCRGNLTLPALGDYELRPALGGRWTRRRNLTEARANFREFGAVEQRFLEQVRPVRPDERSRAD